MSEIQIEFSAENSFSQNRQTRTSALAGPLQNTAALQGSVPASIAQKSSFQNIFSAQDNVQISKSAQVIRQNTKSSVLNNSANSPANALANNQANTNSIALQNGTLSLVQNQTGITGTYHRNNGGSFQFNVNQNVNVQENEDYSTAVFFEQDNISKKYHADGKISKFQGNILDENKKSVRINSRGGTINAKNDTVFALADNTNIQARGNNTIILKENMQNVQIHTQNGDNTIIGQELQNAAISLAGGKNTLNFRNTDNSTVNARNSNVQLNTGRLTGSTLNLEKGTHSINLQESLHNSIHFESNSFNQESKLNIFGRTENTLIHAAGEKTSLNLQNSKNNYIESAAKFTHAKFSHSQNDVITIDSISNTINTGTLTDTNMELKSSQNANLQCNVIAGNSNLAVSGHTTSLFANTIKDNSTVNLDAEQFAHTKIQTAANTAAIDINSAYYNNVAIGTIKDNAYTSIIGDGTISVNELKDNANLNTGTGITHVGIGSISDNTVLQGGKNTIQKNIGTNEVPAEISASFAPVPTVNSQEQTRALNSYISTANNFQKNYQQNQLPINRLV